MAAPLWEAGHLYLPGDLVQPIQAPAPASAAITNPGFESGSTDWTLGTGMSVDATKRFSGTNSAKFTGTAGNVRAEHSKVAVAPGTSITASCMYAQGAADAGHNTGRVVLRWYTSGDVFISESTGTLINSSSAGWQKSAVTAVAPATAAKVAIGCLCFRDRSDASWCDQFEWNYVTQTIPDGLIYQAVQAAAGSSGSDEPVWPTSLGVTVVDNQVTWEAVATSRVTWTAEPILLSGTVEPTWPTTPGEFVSDGTISWECISRRVEDERCPNTKVVAIMAGKVFAVDGDIVRFSATANPLDWTSEQDAGFLPTGLQQANANDMAVLAPYRSNLAAFNASCFQPWQVDPDPANMAILDQMDGIGSTWPKAAVAVSNELFFLAALGVRTVGIAAGAENLSAGDVGEPVDSLVQEAMRVTLANSGKALATYYPSAGQYWLTFRDYPPAALSITGNVPDGVVGESVSMAYVVSGGVLPYASIAVVSGTFPAGLSLNSSTGEVTGNYSTAGSYSWAVRATDADGNTADTPDTAAVVLPTGYATTDDPTFLKTSPVYDYVNIIDPGDDATNALVDSWGGKLFILSAATRRVSGDGGATWAPLVGIPAGTPVGVAYTGTEWIIVLASDAALYVSSDGTNFTSRTYAADATLATCVFAYDNIVMVLRSNSGQSRISLDYGVTWANMAHIVPVQSWSIARNPTTGALLAANVSGVYRSLNDGSSWASLGSPFGANQAIGVAFSRATGRFLAVSSIGQTAYSDDDWTSVTAGTSLIEGTSVSNGYNRVIHDGNVFVIAGATTVFTTPDGVTNTVRNTISPAHVAYYRSNRG